MPHAKLSKNDYSDLNRLSTADFFCTSKLGSHTLPRVFKAERLVCMKNNVR